MQSQRCRLVNQILSHGSIRECSQAFFRPAERLEKECSSTGTSHLYTDGIQREPTCPTASKSRPREEIDHRSDNEVGDRDITSCSNIPSNETAVRGRLTLFAHEWGKLTSDHYILQAVQGYKLEFNPDKFPPYRDKPLRQFKRNADETALIQDEINKLVTKNVIEPCDHEEGEFLSNIFTRPKKSGGLRVILDLSDLNKSILYQHFKMDNIKTALALISPECYLASADLRDAYYTVPIHPDSRKFLRFTWQGKLWQFKVLPNGLSSAPRLFTKLLKPAFANLREQGHIVIGYLDDTLIIGKTAAETRAAVTATTQMLSDLGFIVHPEKSVLDPSQDITFLGFKMNTTNMEVRLPKEKQDDIIQSCTELLTKKNPTIRNVAKVIGQLVASFPAVQYCPSTIEPWKGIKFMPCHCTMDILIGLCTYQEKVPKKSCGG